MVADKTSMLKKCGDILINIKPNKKSKVYVFNCAFCNTICDQLKKFSLHLDEKHSKQFSQEALWMPSPCVVEDETKYDIPVQVGDIKHNLEVFEREVKVEELMEIEDSAVVANEETKGSIIPLKKSIHRDPLETKIAATSSKKTADICVKSEQIVAESYDDCGDVNDLIYNEMEYENSIDVNKSHVDDSDHKEVFDEKKSKLHYCKPKKVVSSNARTDDSKESDFDDTVDSDGDDINVNVKTEPTSLQEPDINYAQMVKIANEPHELRVENVELIKADTIDFGDEDINVNIKTEKISIQDPDVNYAQMVKIANEPLELLEHYSKTHDGQLENAEPINALLVDEPLNVRDKSNMEYFQKFMKSKGNVTALIAAYRNESHLWNYSLPVQYRKKEKRIMTWDKIAIDLKKTKSLQISSSQVAGCIIFLRQKYREKKRNDELLVKNSVEILPTWAFKQLKFLNPFIESKPIALLDIHQDLAPKQTIQILNIFKRCPHLWDSNTVEFYCNNKRNEALTEMKNIITAEMDLEVEESTLQNFLNCVRKYLVLEKRRQMGFIRGVRENVKYYDHLLFLYDHVGPFKCSHCRRTFMTPLAVKSHESKHNGTVPFKCHQCNEEFKVSHSYVCHIRRHMDDYNHECKICAKKCFRAVELEEHMRVHTGDKPFCCVVCGSSFAHRASFKMHMRIHDKKYSSFCPICSKGFYNKDNMTMHARIHKDERDFVCSTCGKAFKMKISLKSHMATHENGNYECTTCGKSFKNRINLRQHRRKHRLNSLIKPESPLHFETNIDKGKARTKRGYVKNPKIEEGLSVDEKELIISILEALEKQSILWAVKDQSRDKAVRQKGFQAIAKEVNEKLEIQIKWEDVRKRIKDIRDEYSWELDKQLKGDKCEMPWYTEHMKFLEDNIKYLIKRRYQKRKYRRLKTLDESHIPLYIEYYKNCETLWQINNIAFVVKPKKVEALKLIVEDIKAKHNIVVDIHDMQRHLDYINRMYSTDKERQLKCELDKTEFVPTSKFYTELSFLSGSQGPFKCTHCNEIINSFETYHQHVAAHTNSVPFKCALCEMRFTKLRTYIVHAKRHLGINNFHCAFCGKAYTARGELDRHVREHTGEEPYLCEICGASFRSRPGYDNHIRSHGDHSRFECHICKHGFNQLHSFKAHVKAHLNIRDILCNVCGKGFTANQHLLRHQQIHSGIKRYKCGVCGKAFAQDAGLRAHRKQHTEYTSMAKKARKKENRKRDYKND